MAQKNSVRNLKKKAQKLVNKNRLVEARDIYIPLCQSVPNDLDSWLNLAVVFRTLNDLSNAEKCCNHVLAKQASHTLARHIYASILHIKGNRAAAINLYLQVLQARDAPDETCYFIANAYRESGDIHHAQVYYEKLLELEPSHFETLNNLSALYTKNGMISKSLALLERASKIQPGHQFVKNNLARAYLLHGNSEKSSLITRSILDTGEYEPYIASNYLLSLNYLDLDAEYIFNEHLFWATKISDSIKNEMDSAIFHDHKNSRKADNTPLKLGIISADLMDHPVARFILSFFKYHDSSQFSIYCYSDALAEDEVSAELKTHAAHWSAVSQLSNIDLAKKINNDQINILLDLAGHSGSSRISVFALKPAPVQITYLGYPNTTGIAEMDYRITDSIADPVGVSEHLHTEKLLRLPECFLAFTPAFPDAPVSHNENVSTNNIMFGSFNNLAKTTPAVIALWSEILHRVPGSKLTLKSISTSDSEIKAHYLNMFQQHDIAAERIVLLNTVAEKQDHYNGYNKIDIALDTFPYNGTTTTFEALWMATPVVTLSGATHVSRVGHSILAHLSLHKLVAKNREEYVTAATDLANDIAYLKKLHSSLREQMLSTSLFDYQAHAAAIGCVLTGAWEDFYRSH
ncbi:TPR domain protein, putative component of TonB system [hydrothermal vent metagenome]|uniref:protein O-GlcNAc transferase n=1 Tax=hydrothermal vent metagenome TaxID=652676 RepID=A0A3B0XQT6_9ZZZZ